MAKEHIYRCAICGKIKGGCNHWYLLKMQAGSSIQKLWNEADADDDGVVNLCGRACAHKALEQWMEEKESQQ